jgi:hypothetical protein
MSSHWPSLVDNLRLLGDVGESVVVVGIQAGVTDEAFHAKKVAAGAVVGELTNPLLEDSLDVVSASTIHSGYFSRSKK